LFLIVFGRVAQIFLLLATLRIATTVLAPDEMGRMSLILTSTAFFALFLVNPVGMFINRRLHEWQENGCAGRYLSAYFFYLFLVCFVAASMLVVLSQKGLIGFRTPLPWLLVLITGSLFFNTINQTFIPSLNLLGYRKAFIVLSLSTVAVSLLSAVGLTYLFVHSAEYWLLGIVAGQMAMGIVGAKIFAREANVRFSFSARIGREHCRRLFGFAWPIAIAVGLNWVQTQGYRFVLGESLNMSVLGLFVAGYGISAGIIAAFESVLTTYFQPQFYKQIANDDPHVQAAAWNNYATALVPSLILLVCMVWAVAPELTNLLLGPAYAASATFVVWGALAETGRVLTSVYSLVAQVKMNTRLLVVPSLLGAIVAVGLIDWLVPLYGGQGAGVALTIAGIVVLLAMHFLIRRQLVMRLPLRLTLKSLVMGAVLCAMAFGVRFLFHNQPGRSATLIALALLGAIFLPMQYSLLKPYLGTKGKV
jgi:O-antigen/teichoic acid export membrane protein